MKAEEGAIMTPRPAPLQGNAVAFRLSPLLWVFIGLFAAAEVVKFSRGDALWGTIDLVLGAFIAIACVLTRRLTAGETTSETRAEGRAFPLQVFACAVVITETGLEGLLPALSLIRHGIFGAASVWFSADIANGITNFVLYCIPLMLILVVLKVPYSKLGIGRFLRGSASSAAVWLVLPVGIFAYEFASGRVSVPVVLAVWLSNLLQNGFSEELLWRGLVFGRLNAVMRTEYALFLQAFLFGAWHLNTDIAGYHGDVLNAIADMIASQAMFGLGMGYLRVRTGNVAIGSAFHLLFDSLQIFQ